MIASTPRSRFRKNVQFQSSYLESFERKLFYEGPTLARKLSNFFALLLLATAIATIGVLSDSTATVIGAMIVAPLMSPIMASAAALVMGNGTRLGWSLILVIAGIVSVVLFSWLLTFAIPDITISFAENREIVSRITPGLLALVSALASGAAGAFILSREEIADSMGGVAIAISLVPPLCVVGIALNQGEWGAAWGSMLLFLTNFVAILFAGGLTFFILGLGRVADEETEKRTRTRATVLVIIATVLITIPLTATTWNSIMNDRYTLLATDEVSSWLDGTAHEVVAVNIRDRIVVATVEGNGELPSVGQLAKSMAGIIGHPVVVKIRMVQAESASSEE